MALSDEVRALENAYTLTVAERDELRATVAGLTAALAACQEAQEPPDEPPPPPPDSGVLAKLAGVHVLHQFPQAAGASKAQALAELDQRAPAVREALSWDGVVAFCARVPWNVIDADFDLLDQAREIAGDSELTVRFMAGRHTPPAVTGPRLAGTAAPAPFTSAGGLNSVFLDAYEQLVENLATWARANGVKLVHLSHYAKDWAEFYAGPEVQALPDWRDNLVAATLALADIGLRYAGPDLSFELPMSGHGPLMRSGSTPGVSERVAAGIAARVGAASDRFFIQGNGWDEARIWGAPNATTEASMDRVLDAGCLLGVQMIQPQQFAWDRVFATATAKHACYGEVYLPSFTGGAAGELRAEAAVWAPFVP